MALSTGTAINELFGSDKEYCGKYAAGCWKIGLTCYENFDMPTFPGVNTFVKKIQEIEPDYTFSKTISNSSSHNIGGCYVATAVYGSYDCPEVWTLRRFRDYTLAENLYGRAFIRTYYAISPAIVKWFGNTTWFKNMWKPVLDCMVERLNGDGIENTPYEDIQW